MTENKNFKNIFLYFIILTTLIATNMVKSNEDKYAEFLEKELRQKCYGHPECHTIFKPIKLEDVSKIAKLHRQDLEGFKYIIESNRYAQKSALGGFLPQISISVDSGKSAKEDISGLAQLPKQTLNFNFSQVIFSMGGPMIKYKMAKEDTEISRMQRDTLYNGIRYNAENDFLTLKKEILRKKMIDTLYDSSKITFEQEKIRKKAGFLSDVQWATAQATYTKDQVEVQNYPGNLDMDIKYLEREINLDIDPATISTDYYNLDKINLVAQEEYFKYALENRPEVKEKIFQIRKADYANKLYKYKYIPEINLTGQVQKAKMMQCPPQDIGDGLPFDNTPLIWHVGVTATWNFDGLSSFNSSKQQEDLAISYSFQKRDLELNILKDIQALKANIETQFNSIKTITKNFETAKTNLDYTKTQYEVGLVALYQYEQSKLAYRQAEFDLMEIKIDLRNNYQKMLYLCGYPEQLVNNASKELGVAQTDAEIEIEKEMVNKKVFEIIKSAEKTTDIDNFKKK